MKNINIFLQDSETVQFRKWLKIAKLEVPTNKLYREIVKLGIKAVCQKYKLEAMNGLDTSKKRDH